MHTRRLATLLLGAWLAGGIFIAAVAMASFSSVDDVLENPPEAANDYIKVLGPASARTLLRHLAAEQNRQFFSAWELAQFGIGAALIVSLAFDPDRNRLLLLGAGVLVLIVVAEHFLVTPHLTVWGRAIDFLPPESPSPERFRHAQFHTLYSWLEVAKGVIIVGLSARLMYYGGRRRTRSRSSASSRSQSAAVTEVD